MFFSLKEKTDSRSQAFTQERRKIYKTKLKKKKNTRQTKENKIKPNEFN